MSHAAQRQLALSHVGLLVLATLAAQMGVVGVAAAAGNTAPTFSTGATDSTTIDEGTSGDVLDVDADDDDGTDYDTDVTYSLGGTDTGPFSIDTNSGQITLGSALDYDNPIDSDGNNDYELTVTATDQSGDSTTQSITVTVTEVSEAPSCGTVSYNGSGTSGDPYEVETLAQLQCIGSANANESQSGALSSDYELVSDIDASKTVDWNGAEGFEPIGSCSAFRSNQNDMCRDNSDAFSGVFDGNGNAITDVVVNRPDGNSVGLFGYTDDATVRNVRLQNATVRADQRVGGLIGAQLYGVVENVSVDGQVEGGIVSPGNDPDGFRVGGIVGMGIRGAVLTNQNVFTGNVTGGSNVGGIIGRTGGSTAVSVSYARANVTATADRCTVCTNTNSPGGPNAGGIAGNSGNPSDIENTYAAGTVTGSTVGGVVGGDNTGTDTFVNVYWDSDLGPGQGTGADYSSSTKNFTGLATAEMQGDAAGTNMGGFDFDSQWGAPTASYPVFRWQLGAADDPDDFFFGDINAVAGNGQIVVSATDGGVGVPGETIVVLDGGDIDSLDGLNAGDTATTDENGDATFSFTEETAGTYVIAVETEDGQASDTAEVVVEAADPSDEGNGEFTATIDGTLGEEGTANVTVRDEFGNPAVGETVTVTDADGLSTISSSATVGFDGNATFRFAVLDREAYTLTFELQDGSLSDTATFDTTCDTVSYETVDGVKQIDSAATLQCMDADLDADYELTRDLNLSAANVDSWDGGSGFEPVGTSSEPFTGTFDGAEDTISNLNVDRSGTDFVGLFGFVGSSGAVTNVSLQTVAVSGTRYVGGLAGRNDGHVDTSSVNGTVSGSQDSIGGLVGLSEGGTVAESYANGSVTGGGNYVGGLVGNNSASGVVSDSYATGAVTGSGDYVGGLVGISLDSAVVRNSYAAGTVTGSGADIGGLVGGQRIGASVSDSYWDEDTTGQSASDGGTSLSTSQLRGTSTQANTNLDFTTTWETVQQGGDASADGYPILRALDRPQQLTVQGIYDPPPMVDSITRASASPTDSSSADFGVTFSENVDGVDATDFTLTTTGTASTVNGDADISVAGSGSSYTVTVANVEGAGTLRLDVVDDDTVLATSNDVALAGVYPATDGSYTSGEPYTIDNAAPSLSDDTGRAAETTRITIIDDLTANDADDTALTVTAVDGQSNNVGSRVDGSNGGRFSVTSGGKVTFDPDGDFESLGTGDTTTSDVTVAVTDVLGNGAIQTVTAIVTGVNDPPANLALSSATIAQSAGSNAVVGTLSSTDVDGTPSYSLVSGSGDADNAKFSTSGSDLQATDASALVEGDYAVRIEAADGDGGTVEESFIISVTDGFAPTVTTSTPADDAAGVGVSEDITVTFNENVVFGSGVITLREDDGGFTDAETFDVSSDTGSGDGTVSITGDTLTIDPTADFSPVTTYAVRIDSGAFVDTASTPNDFGGIGDDTTLNFTSADTVAPTANQGGARAVDEDAQVTFDARSSTDNVGITSYDWDFDDDGATASGETSTHTFSTPGTYDVSLTVEDAAGNTDTETVSITVDAVNDAPTDIALSSSTVAQSGGADASVGSLSITDEDDTAAMYSLVSGSGDTDNDHFRISSGSLLATDATVLDAGDYSVRIEADDGNGGTVAESFTVTATDDVTPTISGFSVSNPSGQTIDISFETTEQLGTIAVGISDTESATLTTGEFTQSGSGPYTYTASYSGSSDGTYTATLNTAVDAASNDGASGQSGSVEVSTGGGGDEDTTDPVADAGRNQTVFLGQSVTLNGSASTDNDQIQSYEWDLGDGATATGEQVRHTYTDAGTYQVELTVTDESDNTETSTTTVRVTKSGVTLTPAAISLGATPVDGTNTTMVELGNDGATPLSVTDISITGDDSERFALGGPEPPLTLRPNESVSLPVSFSPTATGDRTATLSVETNHTDQKVPLTGTGVESALELERSTLSFGNVSLGANHAATVNLTNTGGAALVLGNASILGNGTQQFAVTAAPTALGAGESASLTVRFEPTAPGEQTATVRLPDGDGTTVGTMTVSGIGIGPVVQLASDPDDFTGIRIDERTTGTVTVSNTGNGVLNVTNATIAGVDADAFEILSTPERVAPGASGGVDIAFQPGADGDFAATLALHSNAAASPVTVPLTGEAIAADIGVSPQRLTFSNVSVGETGYLAVTVQNLATSATNLTVDETLITGASPGPFAVVDGDAPFTMDPGESRTITVSYSPTDTTEDAAQLQILSDAGNDPQINVWLSSSDTYVTVQQVGTAQTGSNITAVNVRGRNVENGARLSVNVSQPDTRAQGGSFDVLNMTVRNESEFDINVTQGDGPVSEQSAVYDVPNRSVVQYVELQHSVDATETYEDTAVTFRVLRSALGESAPETVTLNRHSGGEWNEMPLELVGESDSYYRYRAETPGFSQFVITAPDQSRSETVTNSSDDGGEEDRNVGRQSTPRPTESPRGSGGAAVPLVGLGIALIAVMLAVVLARRRRDRE